MASGGPSFTAVHVEAAATRLTVAQEGVFRIARKEAGRRLESILYELHKKEETKPKYPMAVTQESEGSDQEQSRIVLHKLTPLESC